jgi:LysM repeat protein
VTHDSPRNPLRFLAPLALVAFTLAFLVVLTSSDVDSGDNGSEAGRSEQRDASAQRQSTTTTVRKTRTPATYTVKAGDTLAGIAERTGVTVDKLLDINPDIDPQALVSGQVLKLRE